MDLSPPSPSRSSTIWIIIFGVVILIVLILLVIFLISSSSKKGTPTTVSRTLHYDNPIPVTSNQPGEPMLCSQDPRRRQWIVDKDGKGHCVCKFPFTGPDCSQEQLDSNYVESGSSDGYRLLPLYTTTTDNLSFGSGTNCTSLCDRSPDCQGVTYEGQICNLIQGKVTYQPESVDPNRLGPTLYLKRNVVPELDNRIVVYSGTLPSQYWKVTKTSAEYQILQPNTIYRLNFYPSRVIGNRSTIGLISPQPLPSDLTTLLNYVNSPPANVAILSPNSSEVSIPTRWLPLPNPPSLFIVFLPN